MSTLDVLKPACAFRLGSLWPSLEHQPTSPRLCVRGRGPRILVTMRYRLQTSVFCHGGSTLCRRPRYPQSSSSQGRGSGPELVEQALVERHQPALRDLAAGDEEHPDGLPGPQLAVALQLGSASCTACWSSAKMAPGSTQKVALAWAR